MSNGDGGSHLSCSPTTFIGQRKLEEKSREAHRSHTKEFQMAAKKTAAKKPAAKKVVKKSAAKKPATKKA